MFNIKLRKWALLFIQIFVPVFLAYAFYTYKAENLTLQIVLTITLIMTNISRNKAYNTVYIGFDLPIFICIFYIFQDNVLSIPTLIFFVTDNAQRLIKGEKNNFKVHYYAVCRRLIPLILSALAFSYIIDLTNSIEYTALAAVAVYAVVNVSTLDLSLKNSRNISIFAILDSRWIILFFVLKAFFSIIMMQLYSSIGILGLYLGFSASIYVYMLLNKSIYIEKHQVTYRETLKMFVDYFDYGILILDKDYNILSINQKLLEENGLDSVMLVGTKYCDVKDSFKYYNHIDTVIDNLKKEESFHELSFNLEDRQMSITGVKTNSLEGARHTIVLRDTTIKQLRNLEMLTKKKLESLEQLAAGTANDIKNPLAIAQGFIQLLRKTSNDQKHNYYSDQALKALAETDGYIELFALLGNPAVDHYKYQPLDLTELILDIVKDKRENVTDLRNINIHTNLEENVELSGNKKLLARALSFLIQNSIDSIEDSGEINIKLRNQYGQIELQIEDSGSGIDPQNLPKVFDPYFTTKNDESKGLGLFYCKKIIDQHNGTISIQSIQGTGTKVIVKIIK